ncbi:hypothetical protein HJC23_010716 [Cyclotella cryptica]|uniref:DUF7495 domain-containing protein n=1 Tax=Cyclotella cryptica TaxID=29204 RepID=A0ABD3PE83_9STRA|eukprot:CCRYP_015439-RA/>CCRYP_015439-RA protein AED:0.12 eAED:0.39 QI:0/0/0/1/1/1/2/0/713
MPDPSADYDYTDESNTEAPKMNPSYQVDGDEEEEYKRSITEEEYARSISNEDRPSSTARHIELTRRTNDLLSEYGNFLNELGNSWVNTASKAGERGEFNTATADHDDVSYEPSATGESNLWNTGERGYYDYDADRKKLYRYRMLRGNSTVYMCGLGVILALVIIATVSISKGKSKEKPTPTTTSVSRDPSPQGDALVNVDTSYMPTDPDTKELYLAIAQLFQPKWFDRQTGWEGQAYLQAYDFCSSQNKMQPCPYTAICPGGAGNVPYGGAKEGASGGNSMAWAPVKNTPNEWVQVSYPSSTGNGAQDGEICQLFSTTHNGEEPQWGLTGQNNEELTRNILCCLIDENAMNDEMPEMFTNTVDDLNKEQEDVGSDYIDRPPSLEEDTVGTIEGSSGSSSALIEESEGSPSSSSSQTTSDIPAYWFSRSDNWQGTTYQEAEDFCTSQNDKAICPFQLYCPDGPGGSPYDATAIDALLEYDSLFWSPVLNSAGEEAWAGIGTANSCVPPLNKPRASPEMLWNATSFILCCEMPNLHHGNSPSSSTTTTVTESYTDNQSDNQPTDQDLPSTGSTVAAVPSADEFLQAVKEVWDPVWFSTSDGWDGGMYPEAIDFCAQNVPNGELCPYQAICPNGVSTSPYMSEKIIPTESEQWVPTRVGVYSYILVSYAAGDNGDGTLCDGYENVNSEKPLFGESDYEKEKKQYLLCCHHYDDGSG